MKKPRGFIEEVHISCGSIFWKRREDTEGQGLTSCGFWLFFLACAMLFLAGGCGADGDVGGGMPPGDPPDAIFCSSSALTLDFRQRDQDPDGVIIVVVKLDRPAPSGGTRVTIEIEPRAGEIQLATPRIATVTIAEGETTAATPPITITNDRSIIDRVETIRLSATSDNPTLDVICESRVEAPGSLPPPAVPTAPTRPNPVELEFRPRQLGTPNPSDGQDYKTREFDGHYGLASISADEAYERGYFGQGVTIAIAESGVDVNHPDLAGKIRDPWHLRNRNPVVKESCEGSGAGHGTYVALVAAAQRGNPGETFEIDLEGDCRVVTKNAHGVAPDARVMPISMSGGETPVNAVLYAVRNNANVLNFSLGVGDGISYYGKYAGRDGVWLTPPGTLPFFRPLLNLTQLGGGLRRDFADVAEAIDNQEIVLVWAAGNQHWNSETRSHVDMCGKNFIREDGCELGNPRVTTEEFMENFSWINDPDNNPDRTISFKDMWGTGCGEDNCAEYNSPGEWSEAPSFESRLLGKWIAVAASGEDGRIAEFSNGCGAARNWCLVAPGEDLTVNVGARGIDGTSFAAPMVSGALAVLKSRFLDMPMEVIHAILLVSADPVGEREMNPDKPDPVYGWGRLNLGRAIALQGDVRLPYSVPDMAGAVRRISPGSYNSTLVSAFTQAGVRSQGGSLYRGQCVSPYEIIRRYRSELAASRFRPATL